MRALFLEGHAGQVAAGSDGLESLDAGDVGGAGQFLGEFVFVGGVAGDEAEEEVAAAADHVAFADFGPFADVLLEGAEDGFLLGFEADDGEEGDFPAEAGRVCVGVVASDDAGFFEAAHAAEAGWGGDFGAAGEFDVGHAAVDLQLGEDAAVDGVELWGFGGAELHGDGSSCKPWSLPRWTQEYYA